VRLCYLLRYAPTQTETFVYREAAELLRRGHLVRAVSWEPREAGDELPDWQLKHPPGRLGTARYTHRLMGPGARWLSQHQRPKRVLQALWFAHQLQDEGVHAHFAGEASEWARLAWLEVGAPYVVTVHAVDLFKPRPSLEEVLNDAQAVLTVTQHNADVIARQYGVEARVVRCGVGDVAAGDATQPGVVCVARDVPKKGLDLLREACGRLGVTPTLVGADGARPSSEVRRALSAHGVFALPCRVAPDGDRDGLPVALMEAMAAGLPVVTTDLPGLAELVDEDVGWRVPSEDVNALEFALREALADPAERVRRGAAGRARIQQGWTVAHQADGVEAAWAP